MWCNRRDSQGGCNPQLRVLASALIIYTNIISVVVDTTFNTSGPLRNEVIFETETIVLDCRVPMDVNNSQFTLYDFNNVVIFEDSNLVDGNDHFYHAQLGMNNLFLVIFDINVTQNIFRCDVSGDASFSQSEMLELNIVPLVESPACYSNVVNTDGGRLIMSGDVVRLSCYFTDNIATGDVRLEEVRINGTVTDITADLMYRPTINQFKSMLSTNIYVFDSNVDNCYRCVDENENGRNCTIAFQTTPVVRILNNIESIRAQETIVLVCSSDSSSALISWLPLPRTIKSEDINITISGPSLTILVPATSSLVGNTLNMTCQATLKGKTIFETISLPVISDISTIVPSMTSLWMTDSKLATREVATISTPYDTRIFYVAAGAGTAILIAVIVTLIICICLNKSIKSAKRNHTEINVDVQSPVYELSLAVSENQPHEDNVPSYTIISRSQNHDDKEDSPSETYSKVNKMSSTSLESANSIPDGQSRRVFIDEKEIYNEYGVWRSDEV